jgi:hypothetical protein
MRVVLYGHYLSAPRSSNHARVTLGLSGSPMAEAGGVATVTASLSEVSGRTVYVYLAFSGTATVTSDYTRSATSITIPAGSLSGSVTLTAVQDALNEANETIVVDISSVSYGTESGTQQVTATITDDDPLPTVTLGLTGSPMAEAGGVATVTATLSPLSGQSVTVNLTFSGTATLTSDYTRSGTSITIPAGSLSGAITLTAVDDTEPECSETVDVALAAGSGYIVGIPSVVSAVIPENDQPISLVHVDRSYVGPNPSGSICAPFPTVMQGYQAAQNGNTIRIFSGNYNEAVIMNKTLILLATNGVVNIGRP